MPVSAQNLYFHLNLRADDEGFIDAPKKVMRTVGASHDDLKLLLAKRYLLSFESGVIVIKHWKLHNTIRKDRMKETLYVEEKAQLYEKKNGAYTDCQPNDNQVTTKCPPSIEEYSIDKVSIDKTSKGPHLVAVGSKSTTLYKSIESAFLSKVGQFTNYKKEGQAIKGLISKAEKWNPDDPETFLHQLIAKYHDLRGKDKFFGGQPFTPSALNSSGIFDRVMVHFENKAAQIDPEVLAYYKEQSA